MWAPLGKQDVCPNFALTAAKFVLSNSGNFRAKANPPKPRSCPKRPFGQWMGQNSSADWGRYHSVGLSENWIDEKIIAILARRSLTKLRPFAVPSLNPRKCIPHTNFCMVRGLGHNVRRGPRSLLLRPWFRSQVAAQFRAINNHSHVLLLLTRRKVIGTIIVKE